MTIASVVTEALAARLPFSLVEGVAHELATSPESVALEASKAIAIGFMGGVYTWSEADLAMNRLHAAFAIQSRFLSGLAYDIYSAFDDGEIPAEDGESRTRVRLAALGAQLGA